MNLQLSLKRKWFEMTKAGIKTEDYREITPYWCKRLLLCTNQENNTVWWSQNFFEGRSFQKTSISLTNKNVTMKSFETNIMTLGYPKKGDQDRIITLEHKGIEIRTGNPEWGAEEGKLYFVIKHGNKL